MRGARGPKHHLIIEAGGSLDEANSLLGLARASSKEKRIKRIILQVQKHLFTMGGEFSVAKGKQNSPKKRISEQDVKWLERLVEEFEESLALPLGFVAFGQEEGSSQLDVARTSVRKVERMATGLIILVLIAAIIFLLLFHSANQRATYPSMDKHMEQMENMHKSIGN